jgi:hypothetical protein
LYAGMRVCAQEGRGISKTRVTPRSASDQCGHLLCGHRNKGQVAQHNKITYRDSLGEGKGHLGVFLGHEY